MSGHDHDHDHHDHDHDHDHAPIEDGAGPMRDYEMLEIALSELLVEKGVLGPDEQRRMIETWEQKSPTDGRRVVARAWVDADFRARLLADANSAIKELGLSHDGPKLVVLENTPDLHYVVVCTLCSCYPRPLLGLPPSWYKSAEYRSRTVRDPRGVLEEFGTTLPDSVEVRVADSTADCRYLVLPVRPEGTEGWSEAALAELVSRDSMIGVSLVADPADKAA